MDAKTLKALKGSIRKWERIVAGKGADEGVDNCPLCRVYVDVTDSRGQGCMGCPVRERTGLPGCTSTPYFAFRHLETLIMIDGRDAGLAETPEAKAAAQKMLDFLRSLLPPAEEA